jgi:aryl-alcohol dehydrogenase-like predicted oxidoreductase
VRIAVEYGDVPGIDKPISRLVQGTIMVDEDDLPGSFALLDAVVELGGTAFDTARHYGRGNEATVGRWVRERRLQDQVVIIGKGAHPTPSKRNRVTPEDIAADLEESLRQLGLETIDLYLLHRDDPNVPVGPIVEALNHNHRSGKIRAFGGSNWTHTRIAEANTYAADWGLAPFVASSPQFSLVEQVDEPWPGCISIGGPGNVEARAWYQSNQMPIFAWSSLAGGFLSGGFSREDDGSLPEEVAARARRSYGTEANFERLNRARLLAAELDLTVPQIALAYALSQPLNLFTIAGSESREEFAANATAGTVRLSPADLAWLDLQQESRSG